MAGESCLAGLLQFNRLDMAALLAGTFLAVKVIADRVGQLCPRGELPWD